MNLAYKIVVCESVDVDDHKVDTPDPVTQHKKDDKDLWRENDRCSKETGNQWRNGNERHVHRQVL